MAPSEQAELCWPELMMTKVLAIYLPALRKGVGLGRQKCHFAMLKVMVPPLLLMGQLGGEKANVLVIEWKICSMEDELFKNKIFPTSVQQTTSFDPLNKQITIVWGWGTQEKTSKNNKLFNNQQRTIFFNKNKKSSTKIIKKRSLVSRKK